LILTLYSTKSCSKCKILKQKLIQQNIEYQEVDINENPDILKNLVEQGFRQLPIVEDNGIVKDGMQYLNQIKENKGE